MTQRIVGITQREDQRDSEARDTVLTQANAKVTQRRVEGLQGVRTSPRAGEKLS